DVVQILGRRADVDRVAADARVDRHRHAGDGVLDVEGVDGAGAATEGDGRGRVDRQGGDQDAVVEHLEVGAVDVEDDGVGAGAGGRRVVDGARRDQERAGRGIRGGGEAVGGVDVADGDGGDEGAA